MNCIHIDFKKYDQLADLIGTLPKKYMATFDRRKVSYYFFWTREVLDIYIYPKGFDYYEALYKSAKSKEALVDYFGNPVKGYNHMEKVPWL